MGDDPLEPDPKQVFRTLVAGLRSEVKSVLESESANGDLRYSDDGIQLDLDGSWTASIWRLDEGNMLKIECRLGRDERWRVWVAPVKPEWIPHVLHWPDEDFERKLRAAVALLRA